MKQGKLGLWILTALVVGNMVGSGIFMLPRSLAEVASPAGIFLAWGFTGLGVLFTALVFGSLATRKPELTGGPQVYAMALFSQGSRSSILSGYLVTWGYWVANLAGIVAIITTFASYLGAFFPILSSEAPLFSIGTLHIKVGNLLTFLVCTLLLWAIHGMILRGVEEAGKLNLAATAAKVLGFMLFIVVSLFAFQASNLLPFVAPVAGPAGTSIGLLGQIQGAAIATLWGFIGVESAVVFSSRAKRQSDVKKATILGLFLAIAIYMGITLLVMGTLPHDQLVASDRPLVDALSLVVGPSGSYIMAGLGLVSLLGASIGWVTLSSEVAYQAARQGLFPPVFSRENKHGAPTSSLWITNAMAQLFIFSTVSQSISNAFNFVVFVATLAYLIPYIIASVYLLKMVLTGDTYLGQSRSRMIDGAFALISTLYSGWVIKAGTADMKTFLFGVCLLAVGIVFYPLVRRDKLFNGKRKVNPGVSETGVPITKAQN